jgi:hypothetical protein
MKKVIVIILAVVFTWLLFAFIVNYGQKTSRKRQVFSAKFSLKVMYNGLSEFIKNNGSLPDDINEFYNWSRTHGDKWRPSYLPYKSKTYISCLFCEGLNINKEYPPETIIVAEPVPFDGHRLVLLLNDFKDKKPEKYFVRITEEKFQAQAKKQNWKIPTEEEALRSKIGKPFQLNTKPVSSEDGGDGTTPKNPSMKNDEQSGE